jgi:hypothetical protein
MFMNEGLAGFNIHAAWIALSLLDVPQNLSPTYLSLSTSGFADRLFWCYGHAASSSAKNIGWASFRRDNDLAAGDVCL